MSENSEAWDDPYGCRDVSLAEDYVDELRRRIAELDEAHKVERKDRLRLQERIAELEAERDAAFNNGIKRAVEIIKAEINEFASNSYNDGLAVVDELLRMEIEK